MSTGNKRPPRLDVYSIRLFLATAEERSISRAAQRENIAASALSRRLSDLEHAMRATLLVRSARGVELTDAGKYLFEGGSKIQQDLSRLAQEIWSISGAVVGTVRLYANPSAIVGYLPERLREFSDAYPDVSIELTEQRSKEIVRACLDDRADIGVAVAIADVSNGLDSWWFAADPLFVIMPLDHPLALIETLKFQDVVANGLVGVQPGGALDKLLRERAAAGKIPLKLKISVEGFDAACRMVEAGLGVAIVPKSAASAFAGTARLLLRELDEPWSERELRLYALQKQPRSRAVEAMIALLRR